MIVQTGNENIEIVPYDGQEANIHLYGQVSQHLVDAFTLQAYKKGNQLDVIVQPKKQFNLGLIKVDLHLTIQLPKQSYDEIIVRSDTGNIEGKALSIHNLEVTSSTGDVNWNEWLGFSLSVRTDTGDVKLAEALGDDIP